MSVHLNNHWWERWNQHNWLTYMIWYFVDSLINYRKYLRIGCKKNKSFARPVNWFTIESMHEIIKSFISINYISNIIKGWSIYNQYFV